ncbi:hypothetical protein [Paramicrobacterium agarici]|uniref:hypothetical protein n=1 Tax=Paramicrobacterium agarici TaxID=630514 RepID=UPI00114D8944|nr:hypothetical protein [Microbacterium agarici]TQO23778.1 hypothetical protein FB385_2639 [Microbacterium agarici]
MTYNFIAQRATTREFLSMELPFTLDGGVETVLSGVPVLSGTVSPDVGRLRAPDGELLLDEWGTFLFVEEEGVIRWGGIVTFSRMDGQEWRVEAAGFSTYPYGMPYDGEFSGEQVDPADVFRHVWEHIQGKPDGDLGVTVTGSTTVRIGTKKEDVSFQTGSGAQVDFEAGPHTINWWEAPDCGSELDSLAAATPFDWTEHHRWNEDKTDVLHEIRIHYPRAGRRRDDLIFEQGVNVVSEVTPERDGENFANEVLGIGSGEGKKSLRRTTAVRDGRLRRVKVLEAKNVSKTSPLDALIRNELNRSRNVQTIDEITVRQHTNAPIGSWSVGDDILVKANLPWLGETDLWCRIVAWELLADDRARLSLARSDSFIYGG